MSVVRSFLHAHAPHSLRGLGTEHVIMPAVYGVGAVMAHHPVASGLIGAGYLTTSILAVRSQRTAIEQPSHGKHEA